MITWADRNVYMGRLFIDEVQLREGFGKASSSVRARGG